MIHVYGKGRPGDLVRRIMHHADGVSEVAFAVAAGLWAHEAHRDETRHHQLHVGKGAGAWTLYLDNGAPFAFRSDDYESIKVHTKSVRPLGPVALVLRTPEDTDKLWSLIDAELVASQHVAA
jgi:hypothetical protein